MAYLTQHLSVIVIFSHLWEFQVLNLYLGGGEEKGLVGAGFGYLSFSGSGLFRVR